MEIIKYSEKKIILNELNIVNKDDYEIKTTKN